MYTYSQGVAGLGNPPFYGYIFTGNVSSARTAANGLVPGSGSSFTNYSGRLRFQDYQGIYQECSDSDGIKVVTSFIIYMNMPCTKLIGYKYVPKSDVSGWLINTSRYCIQK